MSKSLIVVQTTYFDGCLYKVFAMLVVRGGWQKVLWRHRIVDSFSTTWR